MEKKIEKKKKGEMHCARLKHSWYSGTYSQLTRAIVPCSTGGHPTGTGNGNCNNKRGLDVRVSAAGKSKAIDQQTKGGDVIVEDSRTKSSGALSSPLLLVHSLPAPLAH